MSVVKDVDLEAMPTSIFLCDDDDDDDEYNRLHNYFTTCAPTPTQNVDILGFWTLEWACQLWIWAFRDFLFSLPLPSPPLSFSPSLPPFLSPVGPTP